jgi:hypothetical protein
MTGVVVFTYTQPVNAPGGQQPPIDVDELWECLLAKAANPVPFVPGITDAIVHDRFEGGFHRDIVLRGTLQLHERVVLEPKRRIVYEQLDDPVLDLVTNEIGTDPAGQLTFTLTAALSAAGVERSRTDPGFIATSDMIFYDKAQAHVNAIRLTVALARAGIPASSFHAATVRMD